ncbi:putative transporter C3H1,06c [Talaromyces islandicus]|uniref:Putative transporter C3H1,06c n=1 Tax=Talaromyces islandicus TaxID=28573 RepID=A0A0U1LIC0_TALIS|nr:putative transporter C3H1,06c [Talaromyces islandicus]
MAEAEAEAGPSSRGWRFWAIFPPLCIATMLTALESTITSTSLPIITQDLNSGDNYVWIMNGYLLTSTVFIPFYGQFSMVVGRRWPAMFAVAIFTLGSGISGGANNTRTLIAGRLVQGLGGAGISTMANLIISDLVSVRERGSYQGILFAVFGIGIAIGPILGGVISQTGHWRWVFWLNLPLGGLTLIMQFFFLRIEAKEKHPFRERIKTIDWIGNGLLLASVLAILIALSWADTRYPWSSWHILVPLLVGFAGIALFHVYEASHFCVAPTIPPRLFGTRTSAFGLANTFLSSILVYWQVYFLPLYFEGVHLASPRRAGVLLLPTVLIGGPFAIMAGVALSRWGRYKPIHVFGFVFLTLGTGLYIYLGPSSSLAPAIVFQVIAGAGGGVLLTSILPSIQAALPQSDVAPATATWSYLRQFGGVWGIAIPGAIFNSRFAVHAGHQITSGSVRDVLSGGSAYAHVDNTFIASLPAQTQSQVINTYSATMKNVWEVCLAFCALPLLLSLLEKEIPLRTTVESDYQLKGSQPVSDPEPASGSGSLVPTEKEQVEKTQDMA